MQKKTFIESKKFFFLLLSYPQGTASPIFQFQVCRTDSAFKINAPLNSIIFVESLTNGVPSTASCEPYSLSHCLTPASITCQLATSCSFRVTNLAIESCGKKSAEYTHGTYRFLPSK